MKAPEVFERTTSIITGSKNLLKVWDLPNLPFTEFFGEYDSTFPKVDQALMMCPETGVFQLQNEVDPRFLYNSKNYNFRTLRNPKISRELDFFVKSSSLNLFVNSESRILEIGGNDTELAEKLKNNFSKYVVCDPILDDQDVGLIEHWGGTIEERMDLVEEFQPTVIIGRHVLEHLSSPLTLLKGLMNRIRGKVIFVFEFPNFRLMQQRQRFDAVFHQHLNYFDEHSIQKLISSLECKLLSIHSNLEGSNGGSLVVSFTNDLDCHSLETVDIQPFNSNAKDNFDISLKLFKSQTTLLTETIASWKGEKFGFGAGLMLSTLNYHLNGEVEKFSAIFDDDEAKVNSRYQNLDVEIQSASKFVDAEKNLVLITSMENQRRLRNRLMDFPKSTIIGFQIG